MSKTLTRIGVGGSILTLIVTSFALAQTSPLAASCSGAANQNVVTWTASPSGGNPPYSFLWSGTNVAGATGSVVIATYNTTGTFQASVQVTDTATTTASSSVANANCSATVLSLPAATTTPPGIIRRPGTIQPAKLEINPAGNFLARGMIIQSVASGSFVGKVWGTTWTIETGNVRELLFREGRSLRPFDITQLLPGDEVSVSGRVDPDQALVVNARVVRNFSIVFERPKKIEREDDDDEDERKKDRKEDRRGHGGGSGFSGSDAQSIRDQIKAILDQIKDLEKRVRDRR